MRAVHESEQQEASEMQPPVATDPRELPFVQDALASIAQGGYAEAVARVACMLLRNDGTLPLARLILRQELAADYAEYMPQMAPDAWRRMRGEQEIIVRYEPAQALATLPDLLDDADDRRRLLTLIDKLLADSRVQGIETEAQREMLADIRAVLPLKAARTARRSAPAH